MNKFLVTLFFLLLLSFDASAATTYVCAGGTGGGSSYAQCKAPGSAFASVTIGAGDTVYICGSTPIRDTLTITSTNNVTVDLDCEGNPGVITGADVITSFDAADVNGEYATTATFSVPTWVLVDGVAWKEGVKGSLADNEWAFSSSKVWLGSSPTGRTVEVATRGEGIVIASSTGATVTGGRLYGVRHTGTATGNAAVLCRESQCTLTDTEFYAVRKPSDVLGNGSMVVRGTRTSYCVDGPDAIQSNYVSMPTLLAEDNLVEDCMYGGWFDNTVTSHAVTFDGEGIACTDCASITARRNTIRRVYKGIATRVETAATQVIERNWIEDTMDDGIDYGCTNSSGSLVTTTRSNIIINAGEGSSWSLNAYGVAWDNNTCGNGSAGVTANNVILDSSQGFYYRAAASQTGSISSINNIVVNVDPEQATGTHYFTNWASVSATHSLTITENYNRWYQTAGAGFFRWVANPSARSYANYATYLTDSSQNANSSLGDPALLGGLSPTTAEGFKLKSNSPLCGVGTPTGAKYDYEGYRFGIPPNIGAFATCERNDTFTDRTIFIDRTTYVDR